MKLNTMASVMSYISRIEDKTASYYEAHATEDPKLQELLLSWAKENRKFEKTVKRTYYGVITDAIESNFSFEGLETDEFPIEPVLSDPSEPLDMRAKALAVESAMQRFYARAAQISEGLLADIPRLFKKIATKRAERCESIQSLR